MFGLLAIANSLPSFYLANENSIPSISFQKMLVCPAVPTDVLASCEQRCTGDNSCSNGQKCVSLFS